ncbi:aldo/keto reductase [Conexibacter woesei]|uniref:Aldo/keto reductase n=1 Tax=Conexibacter woesei (strain DSM 14684 / CCUG 47730 / CIP 108061 / JCM 11494 / NBRC 100937 / ID131577) TaxID=469383 RepID=D3FCR6_CONWI|nr:aldo/keto reductase [Conexibacter woesei]ADB51428.1 aldo/keto reductase [Conexibacter woesei DSM 14684]
MTTTASASGTFKIGGDLEVTRLGFGAMRIVGPGRWGEPRDRDEVLRVLRRLPELGVDFIDTADSYGPFVSEDLIAEALRPYERVVVATKGGFTRQGPNVWTEVGRPAYLRQCVQMSLRRLGVERIDLYQLHRIDPLEDRGAQFAELKAFQDEGLVRHLGLSEVTVEEIEAAREVFEVTTVQNRFNLVDRSAQDVLDYCEREGIGFIPWFPLASGALAAPGGVAAEVAAAHAATPGQVALAWLLQRSPVMLPIPGTSSVAHLEENVAAAALTLSDAEMAQLEAAAA